MNNIKKISVLGVAVCCLYAPLGWSQPANGVTPIELFACDYRDGKGMQDLLDVAKTFDKWATDNDAQYAAWIITPEFRTAEDGFDVGWIGSWPSGAAMGSGLDTWVSKGGKVAAAFDKVIDCSDSHALMAGHTVYAPDGPIADSDSVVWFSSCTLEEGVSMGEALAAHGESSGMMRGMGSEALSWVFTPALGAGDMDFDYYSVVGHPSRAALGANFDRFYNGGGWQKSADIMADVASCDSPRLYHAHPVRSGAGG